MFFNIFYGVLLILTKYQCQIKYLPDMESTGNTQKKYI